VTDKQAKTQLERLTRLAHFPTALAAIEELLDAIKSAGTGEVAAVVVSQFLDNADENTKCPLPAQFRRAVYDTANAEQKKPRCRSCDGNRYRSVPVLVRYQGSSMQVAGHRRLDDLSPEELEAFQERLVEARSLNQIILTAAVPCHCAVATA
jgi:hypothetical protein